MHFGAGARHFGAATGTTEFRTTTDPPREMMTSHEAVMGTLGFTMSGAYGLYAGGEAEAGMLDVPGSNAAAAYGIFGIGREVGGVTLGGELAAGYRTIRYSVDSDDYGKLVAEPRGRAEVWLGPQVTLGATAGLTVGEQMVWMAGFYIGVHSHEHDRFGRPY